MNDWKFTFANSKPGQRSEYCTKHFFLRLINSAFVCPLDKFNKIKLRLLPHL